MVAAVLAVVKPGICWWYSGGSGAAKDNISNMEYWSTIGLRVMCAVWRCARG